MHFLEISKFYLCRPPFVLFSEPLALPPGFSFSGDGFSRQLSLRSISEFIRIRLILPLPVLSLRQKTHDQHP